jgi:uncharacterized membrane protein YeaQ/YmgE (transglycosylase-associated protein family)
MPRFGRRWRILPGYPARERSHTSLGCDFRQSSSPVNMPEPKSALRILLALILSSSCAMDASGSSFASLRHRSIREEEEIMSFIAWLILGLVAGFIGSQLVERRGKRTFPDILLGMIGALVGGWSCYAFGPPGVNGLNLLSLYAAVIGSLICLLAYYALRRF